LIQLSWRGCKASSLTEESDDLREILVRDEESHRAIRQSSVRSLRKILVETSGPLKMAGALKPSTIRGELNAAGLRFGIVVSQFNSFITDRLLAGALDALEQSGAGDEQIEVVRVPGSFELPIAAKKLAAMGRFDSIVCVGCVLRGETSHYDVVVSETARGIQLAQLDSGVPMILCVLTCDTLEQAINRAGLKSGNKGYESGLAAVEMAQLSRKLSKSSARNPTRPGPRSRR
jgi:6,7-dimethyl-8-ribityllumazine synthase